MGVGFTVDGELRHAKVRLFNCLLLFSQAWDGPGVLGFLVHAAALAPGPRR